MTNEIMNVQNNDAMDIMAEANAIRPYVSFTPETPEDKVKLYNAMNSPMYRLKSMINKPIKMVDAVLIPAQTVNEETGEVQNVIRSVIIDDQGNTYAASATGVITSLRNLVNVFGSLHFDKPLTVIPKEVVVKRGNTLTLEIK